MVDVAQGRAALAPLQTPAPPPFPKPLGAFTAPKRVRFEDSMDVDRASFASSDGIGRPAAAAELPKATIFQTKQLPVGYAFSELRSESNDETFFGDLSTLCRGSDDGRFACDHELPRPVLAKTTSAASVLSAMSLDDEPPLDEL
jgi:hypothetical protein